MFSNCFFDKINLLAIIGRVPIGNYYYLSSCCQWNLQDPDAEDDVEVRGGWIRGHWKSPILFMLHLHLLLPHMRPHFWKETLMMNNEKGQAEEYISWGFKSQRTTMIRENVRRASLRSVQWLLSSALHFERRSEQAAASSAESASIMMLRWDF